MREYKFRGKGIEDNKWHYGNLIIDEDRYCICLQVNDHIKRNDYEVYMIEVDPSTIGQYIGLNDKNGKEIYEGDIVKVFVFENYTNGYVKYNQKKGRFDIGWMCEVEKYKSGNDFLGSCSCMDNEYDWLEVIGNIYDNPELL